MSANFKIGDVSVGEGCEPFIIAEAGINHNGDIELAKRMVRIASESGVDAVKFQTFRTEEFISDRSVEYTYKSQGVQVTESMFDMFKRTEFTDDEWREIKAYCDECGITFLSTPVSERDLDLLVSLGVGAVKVGSDDFTNIPLITGFARRGLPMLLSCGMADGDEMEETLSAAKAVNPNICLFLCTSQYPTPADDVNAAKLLSMSKRFGDVVLGFSDHTRGCTGAIVAAAFGARVFEKHFTLDHNLPGPDHWFASEPDELKAWAAGIREACKMVGSEKLNPTEEERKMRNLARRSIVALRDIAQGEKLTDENIGLRRPGTGMSPARLPEVLGSTATRQIAAEALICPQDFTS